jgi:hypothetical protein
MQILRLSCDVHLAGLRKLITDAVGECGYQRGMCMAPRLREYRIVIGSVESIAVVILKCICTVKQPPNPECNNQSPYTKVIRSSPSRPRCVAVSSQSASKCILLRRASSIPPLVLPCSCGSGPLPSSRSNSTASSLHPVNILFLVAFSLRSLLKKNRKPTADSATETSVHQNGTM